jgi:hypothetical protein
MSPTINLIQKENVSPKLDKLNLKDKVPYFTRAVLDSNEKLGIQNENLYNFCACSQIEASSCLSVMCLMCELNL